MADMPEINPLRTAELLFEAKALVEISAVTMMMMKTMEGSFFMLPLYGKVNLPESILLLS